MERKFLKENRVKENSVAAFWPKIAAFVDVNDRSYRPCGAI
jgi:hypothetical protein